LHAIAFQLRFKRDIVFSGWQIHSFKQKRLKQAMSSTTPS